MIEDFGYVLKNSENLYFSGYNAISNQLRKAQIYHSITYAEKTKNELNSNTNRLPKHIKRDFEIIKIKIYEIS